MQGVKLSVPRSPNPTLDMDVIVAPLPSSPERALYEHVIREAVSNGINVVEERDPARALYRALAHPWDSFPSVAVGVDPGVSGCAAAAVAEGLLLWIWRGDCSLLGGEVAMLASRVPHVTFTVYLGDGPGFEDAEASLASHGVGYVVVPEEGSTKRPLGEPALARILDRHVLASATIAFRGLARGKQWRSR